MRGLGGADVLRGSELLAALSREPGHTLHRALSRRSAGRRVTAEIHESVRRGQREERRYDRRAVHLGIGLLDAMTELGAELDRVLERREALALDGGAVR